MYCLCIFSLVFERESILSTSIILTSKDDVKILDASAALYMIPIDKYNKNYDLLLKGNLGKDGEEKRRWITFGASCGCNLGKNKIFSRYEHTYSPYGSYGTRRLLRCIKFDNSCL